MAIGHFFTIFYQGLTTFKMAQEISNINSDFSAQFLQLCLSCHFDNNAADKIRKYIETHPLDWHSVSQKSQQERITPLMYSILRDKEIVPEVIEKQFKRSYFLNAIRNKIMLSEMAKVLQIFNDREVPAIVLKGAALSETVYNNLALRTMGDLDLLIQKKDGELAFQILADAGFISNEERFTGQALTYEKELHFRKPGREPINLDLHWHLLNPDYYKKQLPIDWFWESANFTNTDNLSGLIFCPEAQLLHLCGHLWLSIHAIDPNLLWKHDIVALIYAYQEEMDWQLLIDKATECHLVYTLRHALNTLVDDWDAPVPTNVLAKLQLLQPSLEEAEIFARYVSIEHNISQKAWDKLSDIPNRRERFMIGLRYIFPSPAYLRFRYGVSQSAALPFLYLYRIWIGLITGIRVFVSQLRALVQRFWKSAKLTK